MLPFPNHAGWCCGRRGSAFTFVLLLAALGGCEPSTPGNRPTATTTPAAAPAGSPVADSSTADSAPVANQRCQTLLSSALEMIQPENLGITAEPQSAVDTLNNWISDCGSTSASESHSISGAATDPLAAPHADRYELADVEHIRNCRLIKQAAAPALRGASTDAERVTALFETAVRLVALANPKEPLPPQSLYDILIIGNGNANDRVWVFGELLRQTGFDSFLIVPRNATGASATKLVGVPTDKGVLLFDPALGWPIPSKQDKDKAASVRQAATLAEAAADDGVFRKLDGSPDKPYPVKAADLKSLRVQIITRSRFTLPRIKRLESYIAGNRSTTIYVPLEDTNGRPGLVSRVLAAGKGAWKKEDVSVWDYPDQQSEKARHLSPTDAQVHEIHWLPFEGPIKVDIDPKTLKINAGRNEKKQIKARVSQLQGDFSAAIRSYLLVQLEEVPPAILLPPEAVPAGAAQQGPVAIEVPQHVFATNFRAAEDARFWMAICQMELNENDTAAENFAAYLRGYGARNGVWLVQAGLLRGVVLARTQKYALAVQSINQILRDLPENDPRRPGLEIFAARWRAARDLNQGAQDKTDHNPSAPAPVPPANPSKKP